MTLELQEMLQVDVGNTRFDQWTQKRVPEKLKDAFTENWVTKNYCPKSIQSSNKYNNILGMRDEVKTNFYFVFIMLLLFRAPIGFIK